MTPMEKKGKALRITRRVLPSALPIFLSLLVLLPTVQAQTTKIVDVRYPGHVFLGSPQNITVEATVSYSNMKPEYWLGVFLVEAPEHTSYSPEEIYILKGWATSNPDTCHSWFLAGLVDSSRLAGCEIYADLPSGEERVKFDLSLSDNRKGTGEWPLTVVAGLFLNGFYLEGLIIGTYSAKDFIIQVRDTIILELSLPPLVHATVDGFDQGAGPIHLSLKVGSHTLSVPQMIQTSFDTRLKFNRWSDGSTSPNRTLDLKSDLKLEATYVTAEAPFLEANASWLSLLAISAVVFVALALGRKRTKPTPDSTNRLVARG